MRPDIYKYTLETKSQSCHKKSKDGCDSNPTDGLDVSKERICQSEWELVGIELKGQARGSPERLVWMLQGRWIHQVPAVWCH